MTCGCDTPGFNQAGEGGGGEVKVDSSDTTLGFLASKLVVGTNVTLTVLNVGGNEQLQVNAAGSAIDHKVNASATDTTPGFLLGKLAVTAAVVLTLLNGGGNEQVQIDTVDASNAHHGSVPAITASNVYLGSTNGTSLAWLTPVNPPANPGDNGAIPIATNGLFTYLADGAVGQALIATGVGSAPVWGSNFGATELLTTASFRANATTGFFQVGTNTAGATRAATVGNIRGPKGFQIFARNSTDTLDINLFDWGVSTVDNLQIGRTVGTLVLGATVGVITSISSSSGIVIQVSTGVYTMRPTRFDLSANITGIQSVQAFLINISDTTGVAAQGSRVTVAGQNTTGTGATFGGPVQLIPGTGLQSGNLEFFGASGSAADNSMAGGMYQKDRLAIPTAQPTNSGFYHWSDTGGFPTWMTAAGNTIQFSGVTSTTSTAGTASALPGVPAGYTSVKLAPAGGGAAISAKMPFWLP